MGSNRPPITARVLYASALGFFLGVAGFFTLGVATVTFSVLPLTTAGSFLELVFPRFYAATAIAAVIAALSGVAMRRAGRVYAWLASLVAVLQLAAWLWLLPIAHRAEGTAAFFRWHGISMGIDALTMVLAAVGLVFALFS